MVNPNRLQVVKGDITTLKVEGIVNAANSSLLGGGGVDGAIHRAAGAELLHECRLLGGCKTGQAVLTGGHDLFAQHIIHTVGPVWRGGKEGEPDLLRSCYRKVLKIASEQKMKTLAIPAISCGIYGYPMAEASGIAIEETADFLRASEIPQTVIFCCFSEDARATYEAGLRRLLGGS